MGVIIYHLVFNGGVGELCFSRGAEEARHVSITPNDCVHIASVCICCVCGSGCPPLIPLLACTRSRCSRCAAIVILGAMGFWVTWRWQEKPHDVFFFPPAIRTARTALLVGEIISLLVSIAAILIGLYLYLYGHCDFAPNSSPGPTYLNPMPRLHRVCLFVCLCVSGFDHGSHSMHVIVRPRSLFRGEASIFHGAEILLYRRPEPSISWTLSSFCFMHSADQAPMAAACRRMPQHAAAFCSMPDCIDEILRSFNI